jgi:predicted enzyme related to lactoylglutathione lyase
MSITQIGIVAIPIADQDRALTFYVDTLGLEKRTDVPFGGDYRWIEVAPAGSTTTISIAPPPPGKPAGNMETGIILNTDDIDAEHTRLKAAGVDVDDEISRMGDPVPPMFWFRDPENNSLMIVQP